MQAWLLAPLLFLPAAPLVRAELNDIPRGATPIELWGHGVVNYDADPEWWRIKADHKSSVWVQIHTGTGALCACTKGDSFAPIAVAYDRHGTVLGTLTSTTPGSAGFLLPNLPLGEPVWLVVSGILVGHDGYSEYTVSIW